MADKVKQIDIDVDSIIDKLLVCKEYKPGKQANITEQEIRGLCIKAREIFIN